MPLRIQSPDGTMVVETVFSTTSTTRFFSGTINSDTADIEVSIRGAAFSSDPSLVSFSTEGWVVPNPTSYPNGLELFAGENVVEVRSVPLSGPPTAPVRATVLLLDSPISEALPPTSITVERYDNSVNVSAVGLTDPLVTGYNFYASANAGGGTTGYSKLNPQPINTPIRKEVVSPLFNLVSKNVAASADPLYVRAILTQEDGNEVTLETDVDSAVPIPEDVSELQFDVAISSLSQVNYFQFLHNRRYNLSSVPSTIPNGSFSVLADSEPLYYVVTAVFYNPVTGVEYESSYSAEVVANPISVRVSSTTLPSVSRQTILQAAVTSIHRADRDIAVQPGSVTRDTFLDPFSTEAERIRFLLDFIYRASSFDTLLEIDDPSGSGVSIAPASSTYKIALAKALYLSNVALVQGVIDGAFDKLAANVGVTRTAGERSIGELRFYTATAPTATRQILLGTLLPGPSGTQFRTTRAAEINVGRLASYFNPSTGLYSVIVPAQAVTPGENTNVGPRQIQSGAPFGLSVVNDAAFFGGTNSQSNAALAAEARGALSAVDTGTTQGYYQTAASVAGVIQAQVVEAGNPLMMRDFDPTSGRHLGGKVDIWAQGQRLSSVTDTFAFSFVRKRDVQFVVVGDPGAYQFQALDPDLSPANPLAEMLDYASIGLGLRNATTGVSYNLTGVTIVNYRTIRLSLDVPQPWVPPTLTDVILGDYRYRTGEKFVLPRQPVEAITSVVGESTGTLDTSLYLLVHPNSPLALGRSTQAGDYLQITGPSDPNAPPTGDILTVTNEAHVIVGSYVEYVQRLGADSLTVVVTNTDGTVTYESPFTSSAPDYTIIEGDQTNPLGIRRTSTSAISDGENVLISYRYDENFTVTYTTNLVTSALQNQIDITKHACADVLGKGAIPVPVDLTATILLRKGFQQPEVDTAIRTNLGILISRLRQGQPLRRSDVVRVLDSTRGVSFVVLPLTKMVRAFGSIVARDVLFASQIGDSVRLDMWSDATVSVWLLTQELTAATTTGGGPPGEFRGVFQNDAQLVLQTTLPERLGEESGRTFIVGSEGLVIPGYSDDATLISEGYVTTPEILARRLELTANRVLVSLAVGDAPSNYTYWATYVAGFQDGERDIQPSQAEYLTAGVFTFTYDEDPSQSS